MTVKRASAAGLIAIALTLLGAGATSGFAAEPTATVCYSVTVSVNDTSASEADCVEA